jgi:hypothetical protein
MFAHHIERVSMRMSGMQLADAVQLSLQSLDMTMASLKVLFDLVEHSVIQARPLPDIPAVLVPNATPEVPVIHETSTANASVSAMASHDQASVPSPLVRSAEDVISSPTPPKEITMKGSLKRFVSGLGRKSTLRPLTLWSGAISSKSYPASALTPWVGGSPNGPVPTTPVTPGPSDDEKFDQQSHIGGAVVSMPPSTEQSALVPHNFMQVLDVVLPSLTPGFYFSSKGVLCAASLEALVRILTSTEAVKGTTFDDFFFLSFRFFSNPIETFNILVAQYDEGPHEPLDSASAIIWEQDAPVAKVRVAKVFLQWLRRHWRHQWDAEILEPLRQFVANRPARDPASITWDKVIRKLDDASVGVGYRGSRIQRIAQLWLTHDTPPPLPRPFALVTKEAISRGEFDRVDVLHFHSPAGREELARQFCLAASELFRDIDPEDAVRYWKDGRNKTVGEKILRLASFENALAYWTSHVIVVRPTVRSRAEAMEFFIDVASVSASS